MAIHDERFNYGRTIDPPIPRAYKDKHDHEDDEPTPESCKLLSRILLGWTLLVALLIFGLVKACSA